MRTILAGVLLCGVAQAQSYHIGWNRLTNTKITNTADGGSANICPADGASGSLALDNVGPYGYQLSCKYVFWAWNGGVARTKAGSESFIVWGGGHLDYGGNEVYVLNLAVNPPTMSRVTNPSQITAAVNAGSVGVTMPDGNPTARHTYAGLAYLPTQDAMYVFAGQGAYPTNAPVWNDTWWLNFPGYTWSRKDPVNAAGFDPYAYVAAHPGSYAGDMACAYDSVSNGVYCNDGKGIMHAYDPATNRYYGGASTYSGLADGTSPNAVIDTLRHRFYQFANGIAIRVDITSGFSSTLAATNIKPSISSTCNTLINSPSPGLAYDPIADVIVGYPEDSGNTVWLMDPVAYTCTSVNYSGGPPAAWPTAPPLSGINGRFAYFPTLDAFVVLNGYNQDAYLLKFRGIPPNITSGATLPAGTQMSPYSFTFTATGDTPITWSIISGAPPTGVSFNSSTGTLAGTPITAGTFNFTVKADNGYGSPSTKAVTLTVAAVCLITSTSVPSAKFNAPYSSTINTAGCVSPSFTLSAGSLPMGLSLSGVGGTIIGTPTQTGLFPFTVSVADSAGNPSLATSITVIPGPGMFNVLTVPGLVYR